MLKRPGKQACAAARNAGQELGELSGGSISERGGARLRAHLRSGEGQTSWKRQEGKPHARAAPAPLAVCLVRRPRLVQQALVQRGRGKTQARKQSGATIPRREGCARARSRRSRSEAPRNEKHGSSARGSTTLDKGAQLARRRGTDGGPRIDLNDTHPAVEVEGQVCVVELGAQGRGQDWAVRPSL